MLMLRVTDDIILKQIELADANIVFETISKERNYLRKWLPFVDQTYEIIDTESFILSIYAEPRDRQDLVFVIHFRDEFVGLIGFKGIDKANRKVEIGYWLSEQFQKRGIMTQSLRRLVDYAFKQMDINRVQVKCAVGNHPSKNIPKRLGFVLEGIERDGELLVDNMFTDLEIYSFIKSDFVHGEDKP